MGVLIDNGLSEIKSITVHVYSPEDIFILSYVKKILDNSEATVRIVDTNNIVIKNEEMNSFYDSILYSYHERIRLSTSIKKPFDGYDENDLLLLSLDGWHRFNQYIKSGYISPTLIIKP